jgi:hypothetical protein
MHTHTYEKVQSYGDKDSFSFHIARHHDSCARARMSLTSCLCHILCSQNSYCIHKGLQPAHVVLMRCTPGMGLFKLREPGCALHAQKRRHTHNSIQSLMTGWSRSRSLTNSHRNIYLSARSRDQKSPGSSGRSGRCLAIQWLILEPPSIAKEPECPKS